MVAAAPRRVVAGRYRVLDRVGTGAMGDVWRARDLDGGQVVALKLLSRPPGADGLLGCADGAGARVAHPHVLAPLAWFADDRGATIAMPAVRGGSAADLLAEHGPLPAAWVLVVLDQLLRALTAVHAAGLVHRDVKPANVLLAPTGAGRPHALLADFGVAAHASGAHPARPAVVVGTDGYLAPEQEAGAPPDPRQDLYAAGATAVELLTGVSAHRRTEASAAPPGPLAPFLDALMDPDPARRPRSAVDALDRLRRVAVPRGTPGDGGPGPPYVRDRWGPDPGAGPARAVSVAALLCLAGAAALALLTLGLLAAGRDSGAVPRVGAMSTLAMGAHVDQTDPVGEARAREAAHVQFFLGDPQGYQGPEIRYPGGAEALRAAGEAAGVGFYVHAPYIVNVATTNNRIRIPSRKLLQQHVDAAAEIGALGLVVHGGHVNKADDPETGFDNWRKAVDRTDLKLPLLLENTAGGDHAMARRLDRIGRVWDAVQDADQADMVGFCLDTCHAHAGGIELDTVVDKILGITGRIDLLHCNDSRDAFDSGADRHANLGAGEIGADVVADVVRAAGAPLVLETPGGAEEHRADLAALRDRL